jgi:hypothetical protein
LVGVPSLLLAMTAWLLIGHGDIEGIRVAIVPRS